MIQFDFTNTILRFAQTYTVTSQKDYVMVKGREDVTASTFSVFMSLQPMSREVLKMLEEGDFDEATYVGWQYSSDNLPIKKDLMLGTNKGDLKCIAIERWDDYGVYVTGWTRRDAYQTEEVS